MENPPWSDAPAADAGSARRRAVLLWMVALLVLLALLAFGLRRETISFGPVEVLGDGRTLDVFAGSCRQDLSATLEETASSVTIHATIKRWSTPAGDCLDATQVRLDQPLGDREVIDASTGEAVFIELAETAP